MKLPKVLYARIEKDGDESYVIAGASLEDAVSQESGATTTVGIYRLYTVERYEFVATLVKGTADLIKEKKRGDS